MKTKLLIAFCLMLNIGLGLQAQAQTTHKESTVNFDESDKNLEFSATFDPDLTKKIQVYMDDNLTDRGGFSFKNTQADAQITLDNKMTFHLKASPGKLALKFDKRKNSTEFYDRFKKMCEGIRDVIQKK